MFLLHGSHEAFSGYLCQALVGLKIRRPRGRCNHRALDIAFHKCGGFLKGHLSLRTALPPRVPA